MKLLFAPRIIFSYRAKIDRKRMETYFKQRSFQTQIKIRVYGCQVDNLTFYKFG